MKGKQIHHHHSLNITGVSSTVYGQKQEIYNTGAHHNIICIANNGGGRYPDPHNFALTRIWIIR